jgi:diamine N-acetyltransferase
MEGRRIRLRPARLADRRAIFEWLAHSDVTAAMLGPPTFPETPAPDWEEFCEDYTEEYFDRSAWEFGGCFIIEAEGAAVGQLNFDRHGLPEGFAELDIWMRSRAHCGRGWGSDALETMSRWLHQRFGICSLLIRPSRRNARAIRAYEKAGFAEVDMTPAEQASRFGPGDYPDSVVLIKPMSADTTG